MKRNYVLAGAGAAVALLAFRWQLTRLFVEEPTYEVEGRIGPVELRRYPPLVRAEVTVRAETWREALNTGFRRLARYIFGGNRPRESIAMLAPVVAEPEKLPMTAPVGVAHDGPGSWTIMFTMPTGRPAVSLPVPDDASVALHEIPSRRVAVIRYAGRRSAKRVDEKGRSLLETLRGAGIDVRGEVSYAGYDPPWTLPFLRRNEVWIELA